MAGFDKGGRDTGPGRFEAEMISRPDNVLQYLLFNYNIDGNVLKPEHKADLDKFVVPVLRELPVHAELSGMASRTGDREYNRQLSIGRMLRVKEYLLSRGIPESQLPGPYMRGLGEDFSTSLSDEDERDRSVRITIRVGILDRPLFPTIVVPITITKDPPPIDLPPVVITGDLQERWSIRQINGSSAGIGAGIGVVGYSAGMIQYDFLLVNQRTQQMSQCTLAGPSASAGLGPPGVTGPGSYKGPIPLPSFSFTTQSKTWNTFATKRGVTFKDFEGAADWHDPASLGLGTTVSLPAQLRFVGLKKQIDVSTGATLGFPSSTVATGYFTCREPVQLKL